MWRDLVSFRNAFETPSRCSAESVRKAQQRWLDTLPDAQKRRDAGRVQVRGDAELPGGETVGQFVERQKRRAHLDAGPAIRNATTGARERAERKQQARSRCHDFAEARGLDPMMPATWSAWMSHDAAWIEQQAAAGFKLPRSEKALRRMMHGDLRDGRGRKAKGADAWLTVAPQVRQRFQELKLHRNRFSDAEAYREAAAVAEELGVSIPSERTLATHFYNHFSRAEIDACRMKSRDFRARYEPKVQRDYEEIAAGEWWCLDGRTLDIMCCVFKRGEARPGRLTLTGVLDMRSRVFVGWDIRETENSDGILAGLAMGLRDVGAPLHLLQDCGSAYDGALGTRFGTRLQRNYLEDERVGGMAAQLRIQVHNSLPYHAWAKPIESTWRKVKDGFCRWFESFWGGFPSERPEGVDKLPVHKLPTVEAVREAFALYLAVYHNSRQSGRGTYGYPPRIAFDQFRGEVRRVSPALLDLACCRTVGPRTVGRDGVRHGGILYRPEAEDLVKIQRRKVYLRLAHDRADRVTICAENGVPICYAEASRPISQQDVREAQQYKRRYRSALRTVREGAGIVMHPPLQQAFRVRAERARAKAAELERTLPPPAAPEVKIVRPDLAKAAQELEQRAQRRRQLAKAVGSEFERVGRGQGGDEPRAGRADLEERRRSAWGRVWQHDAEHDGGDDAHAEFQDGLRRRLPLLDDGDDDDACCEELSLHDPDDDASREADDDGCTTPLSLHDDDDEAYASDLVVDLADDAGDRDDDGEDAE